MTHSQFELIHHPTSSSIAVRHVPPDPRPTRSRTATQFNSQRPISHRAITAPRMNAAKIQSSEERQDLIGQCQSERSRGDVRPAKLIPGAQA